MTRFEPPRKIQSADDFGAFRCGAEAVDDWARTRARDAEKRGTAVVYVVMAEGDVAGFYSLSAHSMRRREVKSGWLRRNAPDEIPVVLLGMLGVSERFKGQGLSSSLLADAIRRSFGVAGQVGAKALVIDPIDASARAFYEKHGFKPIPEMDRMFIPLR